MNASRMSAIALRRFLMAILTLGLVLVVCDVNVGPIKPEVQRYEMAFSCDTTAGSEDVTVALGALTDSVDAPCTDPQVDANQQPAAQVQDGADRVMYSSGTDGSGEYILACNYTLGADREEPATCGGTVRFKLGFDPCGFTGPKAPHTIAFGTRLLELGAGELGGFSSTTTVRCPLTTGATSIPLNASQLMPDPLPLPLSPNDCQAGKGECVVEVQFQAQAAAAGTTHQSLHVFVIPESSQCRGSEDCGENERCGPQGCRAGDEGDPCFTSYVLPPGSTTSAGDCSSNARFCGPAGRCSDGRMGDACRVDEECSRDFRCIPFIPGFPGTCR